jgi:hypothetical protein
MKKTRSEKSKPSIPTRSISKEEMDQTIMDLIRSDQVAFSYDPHFSCKEIGLFTEPKKEKNQKVK